MKHIVMKSSLSMILNNNPIILKLIKKEKAIKFLILILAMSCPLLNAAENSTRDKLRNAERSPLFQQKYSSSQIAAKGLDQIKLHNGVELQFKKYIGLTRLDENEKFKPLLNTSTVNQYLSAKPTYTENILQFQDRLIVERSMKVSLKYGVCKRWDLAVGLGTHT